MRTSFFIILLSAFLQTTFLPLNLCLILIICRSYALEERQNYYLALFAGIVLGFLNSQNLGFWPLIFLIVVKITHLVKKLPVTANFLTIIPVAFIQLALVKWLESLIFKSTLNFFFVIVETVLALPLFILIKLWEERFIANKEIKLRLK